MSGLINFANALGSMFGVLLPVFCYLGAMVLFLVGAWGLKRQSSPDNPFRGRPWVPWLSLIMCGVLASFDSFLTKANRTGGSSLTVSTSGLTSYVPISAPGSLGGGTVSESLVNLVAVFQPFFQSFGAIACLFAVLAWRATAIGQSRRPQSASGVQFVFGVLLMNCVTVAGWVITFFV